MPHAPSVFDSVANVIAVGVLLAEFGMFRASMVDSQLRLYAVQSWLVASLAAVVAATKHVPELYALATVSAVLKAIVVPWIMLRFLHRADVDLARISRVRVSSIVLTGIVVAAIGFFAIGSLRILSPVLPSAALAISAGEILVAFLLIIARTDIVSEAVGVFSLENGVFVASLVLAWGLPVLLALALVFDLLVAVLVFAIVIRSLHHQQDTLSVDVLDRLKG